MGLLEFRHARRAGRPDAADAKASSLELGHDEFARWLEGSLRQASGPATAFALLVVNLRRSDRAAALMRRPPAEAGSAEAVRRVAQTLRRQDRFMRLGPEHLMLVLPGVRDVALVRLAVNRLVSAFEAPIQAGDTTIRMRPCVGCALSAATLPRDVEALLSAADDACVAAGSADDAFALATLASDGAGDAEGMWEDFHAALSANEMEVWFQPQQDVASGACRAAEALLRWHNKRHDRMISPALAVETAERHGMMAALTLFVLNTSLRQLDELRRAGIDLRIAVNASPSQLHDAEFPALVARALGTWSIPADRLTLEVTEGAVMAKVEESLRVMRQLKQLGVRLSIDDFGTGYSSLAYLQRLPVDELKIDQAFVRKMLDNKDDEQIVRSIIDLAHNFRLEAVAEGVEDPATAELLARLGCDVIQGYLYARPMPSNLVPQWWASQGR